MKIINKSIIIFLFLSLTVFGQNPFETENDFHRHTELHAKRVKELMLLVFSIGKEQHFEQIKLLNWTQVEGFGSLHDQAKLIKDPKTLEIFGYNGELFTPRLYKIAGVDLRSLPIDNPMKDSGIKSILELNRVDTEIRFKYLRENAYVNNGKIKLEGLILLALELVADQLDTVKSKARRIELGRKSMDIEKALEEGIRQMDKSIKQYFPNQDHIVSDLFTLEDFIFLAKFAEKYYLRIAKKYSSDYLVIPLRGCLSQAY